MNTFGETIGQKCYEFMRQVSIKNQQLGYQKAFIVIGCKGKAGKQILFCKVWKVMQNFFVGHSRSHVFENIINSDSHSANAGFSAAHFGIKGNEFSIINRFHATNVNLLKRKSSENYSRRERLFRLWK